MTNGVLGGHIPIPEAPDTVTCRRCNEDRYPDQPCPHCGYTEEAA